MLKSIGSGMAVKCSQPVFGKQAVGVSPGGAMDQFSYATGNALLENNPHDPAFEIIFPISFRFFREGYFVLTGAGRDAEIIRGTVRRQVRHSEVYRAIPGDVIKLGEKRYGLRTYLCYKSMTGHGGRDLSGRKRGLFSDVSSWMDREGKIRVLPGPELGLLTNSRDFFSQGFRIRPESNSMGLRLDACELPLEIETRKDMISGAVSDGTVQLTPSGPVILLRHRQTIGGYPRIFNVISADVDILAQYAPGEILRFRPVDEKEALGSLRRKQNDLEKIRRKK